VTKRNEHAYLSGFAPIGSVCQVIMKQYLVISKRFISSWKA